MVIEKSFYEIITIIVAAYNAEQTISLCLDSLLRQTYGNLQIIVVDDGNREPKASKLREQVALMNQVLVRHEINMGKGAAVFSGFKKGLAKRLHLV